MEFHTHTCDQTKHKHYPIEDEYTTATMAKKNVSRQREQCARSLRRAHGVQRQPSKQHIQYTNVCLQSCRQREKERKSEGEKEEVRVRES